MIAYTSYNMLLWRACVVRWLVRPGRRDRACDRASLSVV